jgi:hypothetical protein
VAFGIDSFVEVTSGCRFSLLSRVRLLILQDFHASDRPEFFFIEYSFSFINRVRVTHSVYEKHCYIPDFT